MLPALDAGKANMWVRTIRGETFNGRDIRAFRGCDRQLAGQDSPAIRNDRAASTVSTVATMLGAREVGGITQCEEQGRFRIQLVLDCLSIDGHAGHGANLGRPIHLAKMSLGSPE